ncbi:MAG TPA: serine/threonine-protein kinase [Gemmatimonadales bacterium]|nr:serine/threonine-protein kinase [Gemmatimonadales bacterium]
MTRHRLIARPQRETPPDLGTGPGRLRSLPDDLLRQASRRLQIIALLGAALWIAGPALGHLAMLVTQPGDPRWARFQVLDAIALLSIALSVGLYFYLRGGDRSPRLVMHLALLYMVATGFDIGVMMHLGPPAAAPADGAPMITWIGPVTLMFAALVPAQPWKMLVAGAIAVSMNPVGMLVGRALGTYDFDSPATLLTMHYPDYLLLGVAVVISHVVMRLGQQVTREREMGSYRLGELLGRGGMGEVYLATHRMLARPAAIKLLRPELVAGGDPARAQIAVARFRREAEAAARLRSPHTVELYDFGVTQEGTLYLVMELLQGVDLETLVRQQGSLAPGRVVHILRQVCESLDEAHRAGLVHRDIKPANIHVGPLGEEQDYVKVLDFGLVKSVDGADGSLVSAAGLTPGTPAYMAPELAQGVAVDARTDLYSLGCVAYYLLTGRLVFEGETAIQVILKHIEEPPVPPSRRASLPVPPALERAVLACLAKRPADRPASAADLARMLAAAGTERWGPAEAARWLAARRVDSGVPRST